MELEGAELSDDESDDDVRRTKFSSLLSFSSSSFIGPWSRYSHSNIIRIFRFLWAAVCKFKQSKIRSDIYGNLACLKRKIRGLSFSMSFIHF